MQLEHDIDWTMDYDSFDGAECEPCGWFTRETDPVLLAGKILAHQEETVPLWHYWPVTWNLNTERMEKNERTRVVGCNLCLRFSSGNTGLDMTLEEVMIKHYADAHPEFAHPALPHNTGVS